MSLHEHEQDDDEVGSSTEELFTCYSHSYLTKIISELRENCEEGKGTDLEVLCPCPNNIKEYDVPYIFSAPACSSDTTSSKASSTLTYKKFQLHYCIASISSDYFRKFPYPLKGRKIDEIQSNIFEICLDFMYSGSLISNDGEYRLSHENVSSVLAAAQLLGIHDLSTICFQYLKQSLDYSNHATVKEIAIQFHNMDLLQKALRFSSRNDARDIIASKRRKLYSKLHVKEKELTKIKLSRDYYEECLQKIDAQWKDIIEKLLIKTMSTQAPNKKGDQSCPDTLTPQINFKSGGAVGRLVFNDDSYVGESVYYDHTVQNKINSSNQKKKFQCITKYNGLDRIHSKPPPRPTKEQYEKLGIVYSYSSIEDALDLAEPGDTIYLMPGNYHDLQTIVIKNSLEIIGLGKTSEEVILFPAHCEDASIFRIVSGCARITNVTLKTCPTPSAPEYESCCCGAHEHKAPLCKLERNGELYIDKCNFFHNVNSEHTCRDLSKVNGIYVEGGKRATIQKCVFSGGAGSAIVVLNNLGSSSLDEVHLIENTFLNIGQPHTYTKQVSKHFLPIPAAVELWKCGKRIQGKLSLFKTNMKVSIINNHFTHNYGSGLACRVINEDSNDDIHEKPMVCMFYDPKYNEYNTNSYKNLSDFTLDIEYNIMENNGFGMSSAETKHWNWFGKDKSSLIKSNAIDAKDTNQAKRQRIDKSAKNTICIEISENKIAPLAFPDGESIMVVDQHLSHDPNFSFINKEIGFYESMDDISISDTGDLFED